MKRTINKAIITGLCTISLAGCNGVGQPFEPRTYGVRNSEWTNLSKEERAIRRDDYYREKELEIKRSMLEEQEKNNRLQKEHNRLLEEQKHSMLQEQSDANRLQRQHNRLLEEQARRSESSFFK